MRRQNEENALFITEIASRFAFIYFKTSIKNTIKLREFLPAAVASCSSRALHEFAQGINNRRANKDEALKGKFIMGNEKELLSSMGKQDESFFRKFDVFLCGAS